MSDNVIEFQQVNMAFGKKEILNEVSFTVEKGETLAVIGPSGSGKSTILRLLIGLLEPSGGKILINGQDVSLFDEDRWNSLRQKMGMVFQYSALFDFLTVGENVAFGLRQHTELSEPEIQKIVAERLEQVGLPGTQSSYPAELPGGMKKRVSLARATALQPGIVLYDEPTAGLDPIMSENINDLIVKTRESMGVTSILVTHDMHSVFKVADRIALLYDTRIAAIGTVAEMRNNPHPVLQQFINGQNMLHDIEGGRAKNERNQ